MVVLITEGDENYFDVLCILWVELTENADKTHMDLSKRESTMTLFFFFFWL